MKGQWIGSFEGQNEGLIMVNVDDRETHFEGIAYLNVSNNQLPSSAASFTTRNKDKEFEFRTTNILPINPINGVVDSWDTLKKFYDQDISISKYADIKGTWDDNYIELSWTTDLGTQGNCKLPKSQADQPSKLLPLEMDWKGFKEYVSTLKEGRRFLFRGQNTLRRLRTSFHRAGRSDLIRFVNEDIPALHRHLSARTKHVFKLEIPDENGAFFNLVQHHGYPTPLLD